jgi:GxxExxY protein
VLKSPFEKGGHRGICFRSLSKNPPNPPLQRGEYYLRTSSKIFYKVYGKLGYGFLEKVYENAMMIEFEKEGITAIAQAPIKVLYEGEVVGEYYADIMGEDKIIIELKASNNLAGENEAQVLNYLKASNIEAGLLFNFGPKPEVRRKAFDNIRK